MVGADARFSEALARAYGKRAGDARYWYSYPGHPEVEAAAKAYLAAAKAYTEVRIPVGEPE
jgi:hypothetical protein